MIEVPLYLYDRHPEVASIDHIRLAVGTYARTVHEPNRTIVRLPLSNLPRNSYTAFPQHPNESLSQEATNVQLRTRDSRTRSVNLSVWTPRRMFLMYPIHQMLATFMYRDTVYPLFRGLFVDILDEHKVAIRPVDETMDNLVRGDFMAGDEAGFLEDFYYLTERLETGDATLEQKDSEFHYEWRGWKDRKHEDPLAKIRSLYRQMCDEDMRK